MIITKTPFRISFFGGGSDYPEFFHKYGGAVLGTTIDKYCWIMLRKSPALTHKYKIVYSKVEECWELDKIEHPAIRATLLNMGYPDPLELYYTGDLPARSGVGSSSAFVVGLIKALATLDKEYWDEDVEFGPNYWTPEQLAKEALYVEQTMLHETVGCQDQWLCSYGGLRHIHFLPNGTIRTLPVFHTEEEWRVCAVVLERNLLLFYTGIERNATDVASSYVSHLDGNKEIVRKLVDLVQDGKEVLQTLAHGGNIEDFGSLLHKSWELKRQLGKEITTPEIEGLYLRALEAGALGGKLLGAGGGGFFLLCVRPENQHKVKEMLCLPHVPFRLETGGCQVILDGEDK